MEPPTHEQSFDKCTHKRVKLYPGYGFQWWWNTATNKNEMPPLPFSHEYFCLDSLKIFNCCYVNVCVLFCCYFEFDLFVCRGSNGDVTIQTTIQSCRWSRTNVLIFDLESHHMKMLASISITLSADAELSTLPSPAHPVFADMLWIEDGDR